MADSDNTLEMEMKLRDFVSSQLQTIQGNINTFAKEGQASFQKLLAAQKEHEEQTKGLAGVYHNLKENISELPDAFLKSTAGALIQFAAFEKLKEGFEFAVEEGNKQIETERGLGAILETTGEGLLYNKEQLIELAEAYQTTTKFTAMQTEAGEGVLITFDRIGKDTFPRALKASQDLAAFLGTDVKEAATKVGQALEQPETAARRLRAMNILLTESQKDQIKTWVTLGDQSKAQAFILDQIEHKIGSFAEKSTTDLDFLKNHLEIVARSFGVTFVEGVEAAARAINHLFGDNAPKTAQDLIDQYNKAADDAKKTEFERIQSQHEEEMEILRKHTLEKQKAKLGVNQFNENNPLNKGAILEAERTTNELMAAEEMRFQEFMRNYQTTDQKAKIEAYAAADIKAREDLKDKAKKFAEDDITINKEADASILSAKMGLNKSLADLSTDEKDKHDLTIAGEYISVTQWYEAQKKLRAGHNQALARLDEELELRLETIQNNQTGFNRQELEKRLREEASFQKMLEQLKGENKLSEVALNGGDQFDLEKQQIENYYTSKMAIVDEGEAKHTITVAEAEEARHVIHETYINKGLELERKKDTALRIIALSKVDFDAQIMKNSVESLEIIFGKNKGFFLAQQSIEAAMVAIRTARQVAQDGLDPFTMWKVPYDIGLGVSQEAIIAAQTIKGFEFGGMPSGRNALIRVNEKGQEAVLNARATSNIGPEGVNALNRGEGLGRSLSVDMGDTYISIQGNATQETVEAFRQAAYDNRMDYLRDLKRDMLDIEYHGITA